MDVWLFSGANGLNALTSVADGSNLPEDHGPWALVRSVTLPGEAEDEKDAMVLIEAYGFCCFES